MADPETTKVWTDVRGKLVFLVKEYCALLEHVNRGIAFDLLNDEVWNQEFLDKSSYIGMSTQMEIQAMEPEQRQEIHDLLMPDDPSTERR
jgi:hypothetical protein